MPSKKRNRKLVQAWFNQNKEYDSWILEIIEKLRVMYEKQQGQKIEVKHVLSSAIEALHDQVGDQLDGGFSVPPMRDMGEVEFTRESQRALSAILRRLDTIDRRLESEIQMTPIERSAEIQSIRQELDEYDEDYGPQARSVANRYNPIVFDDEDDE